MILDGKVVKESIKRELFAKGTGKTLAVIYYDGHSKESSRYIQNKKKFGEEAGFTVGLMPVSKEDGSVEEFRKYVKALLSLLNHDVSVDGIIVQLPFPHFTDNELAELVDPKKDVDGFHPTNIGKLIRGDESGLIPATPKGIISLLDYYKFNYQGGNAVVIGRSNIVGKPIAALLTSRDMTVTLCHSKTQEQTLRKLVADADLIILAIGQAHFMDKTWLRKGQTVVDVGINFLDGKMVGDLNPEGLEGVDYTPVPGGVGQTTVASLFQNLGGV